MAELLNDLESNPIESTGHIYHPIPFPELAHLKTSSNTDRVSEKLDLIRDTIKKIYPDGVVGKSLLDIGANGGFYSFSLAQDGGKVTAVEPHPRYARIGKFLAEEKKELEVTWISESLKSAHLADKHFDFGFLLSVFQWMCEGNSRLDEGKVLLREISQHVDVLFFELGINSGKSAIRTKKLNHLAYIYNLLKVNTCYEDIKLIGITYIWAPSQGDCSFVKKTTRSLVNFWRRHNNARYLFVCSKTQLDLPEPWFAFLKKVGV